jgi:GDP-L-fucose synthase
VDRLWRFLRGRAPQRRDQLLGNEAMATHIPPTAQAGPYDLAGKRVLVAGASGMVGSALVRRLRDEACEIVTANRSAVDLTQQAATTDFIRATRPHLVFLAAAKVGGILANVTYPVDFLYSNLMIAANVTHVAHEAGVERLVFLGSSAVYPRHAPQPMVEAALMTGPLEPSHEWYAIAKIAGLKLGQAYRRQYGCDFVAAMLTNLYGPNDTFDLETSHVVPALLRKAHEAKVSGASHLTVWGSGTPLREFLHVDDCADALVHVAKHYSGDEPVNVGSGLDLSIGDLARLIADVVGFTGEVVFDTSKPDGPPRKLLCNAKLAALGWRPEIGLREGLAGTYRAFLAHAAG